MLNEMTTGSSAISGNFIFNYIKPKFTHECIQCGFRVDLYYDPDTECECPFCKIEMRRPTQDLAWYQDSNSSWGALQKGFYAGDALALPTIRHQNNDSSWTALGLRGFYAGGEYAVDDR